MENKDANGVAHYPGWSLAALKYLYEERKIAASGHETTDTDPGTATSKDDYGAIVGVSFPKPKLMAVQGFPHGYLLFCGEEKSRVRGFVANLWRQSSWSKMCLAELTKSRGRNEGRR
jgi:hypothetical protein